MTACMYIQPQGIGGGCTLLLADTMATRSDLNLQSITPVNRTAENYREPSRASVVRKIYILNDRTVIAFAGNSALEIKRCLEAVEGALPAALRADVPMNALADVVNNYPGVDAVAATILANGRIDMMSRPGHRFTTTALGQCAAIGTGSAALRRRADIVDQNVAEELRLPPVDRAMGFAKNVASICFGKEIGGEVFDWGACMEYAYAEEGSQRWTRAPKTLHVFCALHVLDDGRATVSVVQRKLFYDPGSEEGRLLNFGMGPDMKWLIEDLPLRNLLHPILELDRLDSPAFWNAWRPERASIAMLTGYGGDGVATVTNDYEAAEDWVEIDWPRGQHTPARLAVRFPDEVYRAFCREAVEQLGFEFVPPSKLPDDVRASLSNARMTSELP